MRALAPVFALLLAATPLPVAAQSNAAANPAAILAEAGPGVRWGMVVADAAGREIVAIDPDGRYIPASNTKVFTTAAALWAEAQGTLPPQVSSGARVRLEPARRRGAPDVVIEGHGDARLSAAADCVKDCLAALADAVATRTRRVGDVVGDATAFPDQRWSPGMSWNNIPANYGTAAAALVVDSNELAATVTPAAVGQPPAVALPGYYTVDNRALTVAGDASALAWDRAPNGRVLLLAGTIGAAAKPATLRLGIDDPAHYAAWRFAEMLRARGVKVGGEVRARYRPLLPSDEPAGRSGAPAALAPQQPALAALEPGPLIEDVATINKVSQNLHAELLLRRLGAAGGSGSIADGQAVVRAMLDAAGVPVRAVSLSDGSGMSSYNRVAPRGMVTLLGWIARQSWGAAWRATLPVGGVDGTLARRFVGTPLAGKVFAKTGTLNASNALAGWLVAASGRELTFAVYAGDVPDDVRATQIMDKALLAIAAAN